MHFCIRLVVSLGFLLLLSSSGYAQPHKYSNRLTAPFGLDGYFDYKEALAAARRAGKPLLIDFTGHTALNAIRIEQQVWPDSAVLPLLRDKYIVLQLYVDDKTPIPAPGPRVSTSSGRTIKTLGNEHDDFQKSRFGTNYQPYYVLLNPVTEQRLVPSPALDFSYDPTAFAHLLRAGILAMPKQP
jgi:thiol:disulfide interchange protein DsbD